MKHILRHIRSAMRRGSNHIGVWLDTRGLYRTADVFESVSRAVWSRLPKGE